MNILEIYQDLILDHGTNPRNNHKLKTFNYNIEGLNPLCGDKIHIYINIKNKIIKNISFTGHGCAISIASASMMTEIIKNKTIKNSINILENFKKSIKKENKNKYYLGKLESLSKIKFFPSRIKCVTLSWNTLKLIIEKNKKELNNENK